jgi:hypothetical protein
MLPCELELIHLLLNGQLLGALVHYPVDALAQLSLVDTILRRGHHHRVLSFSSDLPV